jgi:hypothetical protein
MNSWQQSKDKIKAKNSTFFHIFINIIVKDSPVYARRGKGAKHFLRAFETFLNVSKKTHITIANFCT